MLCLIKTNLINFWCVPHSFATAVGFVGTALAGVREHLESRFSKIVSKHNYRHESRKLNICNYLTTLFISCVFWKVFKRYGCDGNIAVFCWWYHTSIWVSIKDLKTNENRWIHFLYKILAKKRWEFRRKILGYFPKIPKFIWKN